MDQPYGEGGAVFVNVSASYEAEDTVLEGNIASDGYAGGAIYKRGRVTFEGEIQRNESEGFGGGVMNLGSFEMSGGFVSANTSMLGGGGIGNFGEVSLNGVDLNANLAIMGGALYSAASPTGVSSHASIANSGFSENRAQRDGGAIWNGANSLLTINGSSFNANVANSGGAVYSMGESQIIESSIRANEAQTTAGRNGQGGGVFNAGQMTVVRSTIAENTANIDLPIALDGSGLFNRGTLSLHNVAISRNISRGSNGAALHTEGPAVNATLLTIRKTRIMGFKAASAPAMGLRPLICRIPSSD